MLYFLRYSIKKNLTIWRDHRRSLKVTCADGTVPQIIYDFLLLYFHNHIPYHLLFPTHYHTSNVTGRHRGYNAHPIYVSGFYVAQVLFFIIVCAIVCFLCTMCVLCGAHIQRSSIILTPGLPLCQISFLLHPPLLSLPVEKNFIPNHSLTHAAYLMAWELKLLLLNTEGNYEFFISHFYLGSQIRDISKNWHNIWHHNTNDLGQSASENHLFIY